MTRIEIELYADRLSRHAERLRDDLEGARMRLGWLRLEFEIEIAKAGPRNEDSVLNADLERRLVTIAHR